MKAALDSERLDGKRALVLGASQGIGQATAIALAKKGCAVTILARNAPNLQETIKMLPEVDGEHRMIACDLLDLKSLNKSIEEELSNGPLHILICNAGGPKPGSIMQSDPQAFRDALEVHIVANTLIVQKLVPGMQEAGYGRIINIISTSVKAPIPNLGVSNTTRGAVANWAKTLANELGPLGITVNNVLPGFTKTSRLTGLLENSAKKQKKSLDEMRQIWEEKVPLQRFAEPFEVAGACAFLASPVAGYCNGINIPVDGGRTPVL